MIVSAVHEVLDFVMSTSTASVCTWEMSIVRTKSSGFSYAANWGPASGYVDSPVNDVDDINLDAAHDQSSGPFFRNSRSRFRDILDDTATTIALGERTNGPILDDNGLPIGLPSHPNFETAWFDAVRDNEELTDGHGHMVLFDAEFGPNQSKNGNTGLERGVTALDGLAQFRVFRWFGPYLV